MGVHMNVNVLQMKSIRLLFVLFLASVLMLGSIETAKAFDYPQLPRLSLSGNDQWDQTWYPDGQIWEPASANEPREFLMPVFVDNRWHVYTATQNIYQPDPITSFSFKLMYNNLQVRPVGIETSYPYNDTKLGYLPLANKFQISWYDQKDWDYGFYMEPNAPFDTYSKGRVLKIVATSSEPLPCTDLQSEEFKVLLYIRFQIIPQDGQAMGNSQFKPIYVKPDTIMWNNHNVRTEAPFKTLRPQYLGRDVTTDYPDPNESTGLAGVNNQLDPANPSTQWRGGWRMLPGVIYLRISDNVPQFGWQLQRGIGTIPPIREYLDNQNNLLIWDMQDPITVDSGSTTPLFGSRTVQIINSVSASRLLDIEVESDQPWLTFRLKSGLSLINPNPIPSPTTHGYIYYMDNGILGDRGTPLPTQNTTAQGLLMLEIRCDPAHLQDSPNLPSPEMAGIYVGYITFKSPTAYFNPVKLRITFLYFRTPIEVNQQVTKAPGIQLDMFNSSVWPDSTKLIFGTGYRATDGVDSLFGEYAYDYDMGARIDQYGIRKGFDARFYPPKTSRQGLIDSVPYGFGDFAPDDDNTDGSPKRSYSRDIRSITDTLQSLTYYVKFREDTVNNYPIVLEWDTGDFPDGAQLYLKDGVNGSLFFDQDMRKAHSKGANRMSFTFNDVRVKEFYIEYTLPKVIDYVDEFGAPIIKKGWNLLSLPVRPINNFWSTFYTKAMTKPQLFTQNVLQFEDYLKVGYGYWIKYADQVDTKFAGTFIHNISITSTPPDSVKLYPGWNTIGCVSTSMNVKDIAFDPYLLFLPSQTFVRAAGIWGYKTDRGYEEVSEIRAGLGYYIKTDTNVGYGYLKLNGNFGKISVNDYTSPREAAYAQSAKLFIRDNDQRQNEVYFGNTNMDESLFELPPAPPEGIFDVRFNQGTKLATSNSSVIKLQGVTYPLSMNMNRADANYKFYDAVTNELLGQISKGTTGSIDMKKGGSGYIKVTKSTVEDVNFFIDNYPNPVVNSTTVRFGLPEDANVVIKVYNNLGAEVGTLVNGFYRAGEYPVNLDAASYTSGTYMLRIFAGNNSAVQTMTVIK
jgi:hypothetical protein